MKTKLIQGSCNIGFPSALLVANLSGPLTSTRRRPVDAIRSATCVVHPGGQAQCLAAAAVEGMWAHLADPSRVCSAGRPQYLRHSSMDSSTLDRTELDGELLALKFFRRAICHDWQMMTWSKCKQDQLCGRRRCRSQVTVRPASSKYHHQENKTSEWRALLNFHRHKEPESKDRLHEQLL